MCLVIDACIFLCVFDERSPRHKGFRPIFEWINLGKGKVIVGGTKYKREISEQSHRRMKILVEFEKKNKLVRVDDGKVDKLAKQLKDKVPERDFDDEHLVALIALSKCCVICTDDSRAFPYLKRADLYPKRVKPPKIYRTSRHAELCCDAHIVPVCR